MVYWISREGGCREYDISSSRRHDWHKPRPLSAVDWHVTSCLPFSIWVNLHENLSLKLLPRVKVKVTEWIQREHSVFHQPRTSRGLKEASSIWTPGLNYSCNLGGRRRQTREEIVILFLDSGSFCLSVMSWIPLIILQENKHSQRWGKF